MFLSGFNKRQYLRRFHRGQFSILDISHTKVYRIKYKFRHLCRRQVSKAASRTCFPVYYWCVDFGPSIHGGSRSAYYSDFGVITEWSRMHMELFFKWLFNFHCKVLLITLALVNYLLVYYKKA